MPSPTDTGPVLRLADVRHRFRSGPREVAALAGISATAMPATVTGLIGPDGAGKTTLLRLIAGLLQLQSGHIEVLGIDVGRDPLAAQARLGYMPQRFGLYEDLTVQENLDLYADLQDVAPAERRVRYAQLLPLTGLGPFTKRLAGRLSGGMKQKLGLACTLLHPPEVLLLDEPTVGVDPVSRRELWRIISQLTHDARTTVLFSTAYLDEAERCDQVILLHEGRLLGSGTPAAFTAEIAGRSFLATADLGRRSLQARLSAAPGILDAVIQGDHVRIVTAPGGDAASADWRRVVPGLSLKPAAPRFEDSFVAKLRGFARTSEPPKPVFAPPARVATATAAHEAADAAGGPRPSGEPVIAVDHLTRRFGPFVAVHDVSFAVDRGEIFGLLGANGAGKSTTFRMLCGLLPASEGRLRVAGFDLRTAAATARARIGYMAQRFSLYADLSVRQNLRFFSSAYRLFGARQIERIAWAVAEFDLGAVLDATARDLALGYKQRLALACALMHEPQILFLDEPTSGVDPLARREFWRRINSLAESGVTVLVTTHFMEEAEYCDRLVILANGRVLTEGSPAAIKARARRADRPEPSLEDAFIAMIESAGTEVAS